MPWQNRSRRWPGTPCVVPEPSSRARWLRVGSWLLLLVLAAPGLAPLAAQSVWDDALEALERSSVPPGWGDEARAYEALQLLDRNRKPIRGRELADAILRDDPDSFSGHYLVGLSLHRVEGSLPQALFYLERGRALFEERYGPEPTPETPWRWHALMLAELSYVSGAMGQHEEKIRFLLERDALYDPPWPADRGWPLMRLRRYDEARQAAQEGLRRPEPQQQATARTALCAIEAELHEREGAYEACLQAVSLARELTPSGPTVFTNAAEAALGLLRHDEAERLIVEGSEHFAPGTVSNPWMDLTLLYLGQGRTSEALDALRAMFRWRRRQPAFVHVQNQSELDTAAAAFLLTAGRFAKATELTTRILDRPDRTGFTSSESEQMVAAAAVLDSLAHRLLARERAEAASWLPWREALVARLTSVQAQGRAWRSARRAAAAMADLRILHATLRPYLAGSVEMPEWFEGELIDIMGPGVVAAALRQARQNESLADGAGYFDAFEAEVAMRQGRAVAAMDLAELAEQGLPSSELLIRARVAAVGARAALAAGQSRRALGFLDRALQLDPGIVRRFDIRLPVVFEAAAGTLAERTVKLLRRSPRFRAARDGFRIQVEGAEDRGKACLLGPQGSVLACARVAPRAEETTEARARRLAAGLHEWAFAPRVDLTQSDLRSLDGSPTAGGGRSAERLRSVLDDVIE